MILHDVRVHPSKDNLKREDQLAGFAALAADKVPVEKDVAEMIVNRVIDNAAVAVASVNRHAPMSARDMALGHPPVPRGATGAMVFGVASGKTVSPEYAAWAERHRGARVGHARHLPAQDYPPPADNIPPILAVAQTMGKSGRDLVRGIATGYEIHINLVRAHFYIHRGGPHSVCSA